MIGIPEAAISGKYDGDGMCIEWTSTSSCASCAAPAGTATGTPSAFSTYFRCHQSSTLWTVGTTAKLYSGGGEGIDHSRVRPSHGSAPASSPRVVLEMKLIRKISTENAMINAPAVAIWFQRFQPRSSG